MSKTIPLAPVREFLDPDIRCFEANGQAIAVVHRHGEFFALDNLCPHKAAELCSGELLGHHLQCPWHKAKFDIRDGSSLSPLAPNGVKTWPLEIIEKTVHLVVAEE